MRIMSLNLKRFIHEEAQATITRLGPFSQGELDSMFSEGKVPDYEEIVGKTAGGWLAKPSENYWWSDLFIKVFLASPWARWSGKGFFTPFGEQEIGRGANLFQNRFRPVRYKLDTFIKKADVRVIEDGVFLGQMHFKFFWRRSRVFIGYFVLCALK